MPSDSPTSLGGAGERSELSDVEEGVASYQLYALRREQGRAEEAADVIRRHVERSSDRPDVLHRALLALALAEIGNPRRLGR